MLIESNTGVMNKLSDQISFLQLTTLGLFFTSKQCILLLQKKINQIYAFYLYA